MSEDYRPGTVLWSTVRYWPNPAHKRETTEAGPPAWRPDKEPCPDDLTVGDRNELLAGAIPADPASPHSRRYNVRRTITGLEVFEAKFTEETNGIAVFHGHPASYVPAAVLRQFREVAEYKRLVKAFGSP